MDSYTVNTRLPYPSNNQTESNVWPLVWNNFVTLDGFTPIGGLAVSTTETASNSLNVQVSAGQFKASNGSIVTYAGTASKALTASATNYVYLSDTGTLVANTSGFPTGTTPYIPLATVLTESANILTITDARISFTSAAVSAITLTVAGGTLADGSNLVLGSTTGTQIATAITQKLGFYGVTAVTQPTAANQATLSTSVGTYNATIPDVGASFNQTTLNGIIKSIVSQTNAIQAALVTLGLIKGS